VRRLLPFFFAWLLSLTSTNLNDSCRAGVTVRPVPGRHIMISESGSESRPGLNPSPRLTVALRVRVALRPGLA
jgi:hypothetical protein